MSPTVVIALVIGIGEIFLIVTHSKIALLHFSVQGGALHLEIVNKFCKFLNEHSKDYVRLGVAYLQLPGIYMRLATFSSLMPTQPRWFWKIYNERGRA